MRFASLLAVAACAVPLTRAQAARTHDAPAPISDYTNVRSGVMPRSLTVALKSVRIPSFARQTKLACSACHYQFPELTPFGRLFKLNGYTMTGLTAIESTPDSGHAATLSLAPIPPASAMFVVSLTHLSKMPPQTQNNVAYMPDQASIFLGGAITPKVGAFTQFTYAQPDGAIGIDNVDFRFADHHTMGTGDLLYGITLHNNPTVQDVWNTVPAWSYPFLSNPISPEPIAGTIVDGALGQSVVGLGAYGLWNSLLYTEVTGYRSAQQGTGINDASSTGVLKGVTPYWRLALQHQFGVGYLEVGTYGMAAKQYPEGVTGPTDNFTDLAGDAQFEHAMSAPNSVLILRTSLIHESRTLDATFAAGGSDAAKSDLTTARLSATYEPSVRLGFSAGYFQTSGKKDATLYADGSANGDPKTSGFLGEFQFNPWENTRFALQYIGFSNFNGASKAYDGTRNASDNNALYAYTWIAF